MAREEETDDDGRRRNGGGDAGEGAAAAAAAAAAGGGGGGAAHRFFVDRSKVRILLCDNNPMGSQEALQLLCNCNYQVTPVKSARQVINVLNAQGMEIDIILAEIDLPVSKGLKMLKYITRNKELRRIPIIMMSAQDEVSVVVKCLQLGAADYLVKPLRTNELLNLWTHMWRRRRMLGLPDKDVFSHDIELGLSDPSDGNTNSTTLLSDDTDDKLSKEVNLEISISNHIEYQSTSVVEPIHDNILEDGPNVHGHGNHGGGLFSFPKKIDLKVGESSAFLTYVKSSAPRSTMCIDVNVDNAPLKHFNSEKSFPAGENGRICHDNGERLGHRGEDDIVSDENRKSNSPLPSEYPMLDVSSNAQPHMRNEAQMDASNVPPMYPLPFYYPGSMEQNMMPLSGQIFQGGLANMQGHTPPAMLQHYGMLPQYQHMPLVPSFSYPPLAVNLQSAHMAGSHVWSSMTSSSNPETKHGRTERRQAALVKFRQKRKDRCFDKKIRYVNRKHLAEKRPRVRGQFVRQVNNIDLNHTEFASGLGYSEDEDDDDEPTSRELELTSSPDQNVSEY